MLRTDSPDWKRLEREGFQLIPFNSPEHHIALINARFLICSDIVDSLISPLPQDYLRDLLHYRFVFLNHGVIKDDISRWLNSKDISLFVTSTPAEFASIADEDFGVQILGQRGRADRPCQARFAFVAAKIEPRRC